MLAIIYYEYNIVDEYDMLFGKKKCNVERPEALKL